MMRQRRRAAMLISATVAFASGCGSNPAEPPPPPSPPASTTLEFTVTPIPESAIEFVVPIGNLNPPGHTFPSDHTYFYHRLNHPSAPAFDVVAPAAGLVKSISRGSDDAIRIEATPTKTYYLGHVILDGAITTGRTVAAGDRLGVTSSLAFAMDLGLINSDLTLFFITPGRYPSDTLHADSPFKYFAEPLRARVYAKQQGTGANKDGKIDFDQAGKLVGNWYLEGLSIPDSPNVENGPKHLAFVRDVDDPNLVRISIGGTVSVTGVYGIPGDAPDPATVTPSSGLVSYRLLFQKSTAAAGVMFVQMLEGAKIKVETFPGSSASPTDFTGAAQIYVR